MARQKESENGTGSAGRETVVEFKAIKGQEREKDDEETCEHRPYRGESEAIGLRPSPDDIASWIIIDHP